MPRRPPCRLTDAGKARSPLFFGSDRQRETSRAPWSQYSQSFFRPKPIFLRALERVDSLTETPATLRRYSRLSASLAKGRSSTSASRSLLAFSSSRGFLPGAFPGESERPSRVALA